MQQHTEGAGNHDACSGAAGDRNPRPDDSGSGPGGGGETILDFRGGLVPAAESRNPAAGPSESDTIAAGAGPAAGREDAAAACGRESGLPGSAGGSIGPYEIESEIGRGGMGVVYKAFHPGLKRTVALKVMIAGEDASEDAIARFHREAEAVAKLGHHPNIVPVYDIGRAGKLHYFAMHFVDGVPLDRLVDEGGISPRQAALVAMKAANALQHAHCHGILHRDVKPANILMAPAGEEGRVKPKSRIQGPGGPRGAEPPSRTGGAAGREAGGPAVAAGAAKPSGRSSGTGGVSLGLEPMLTDFGLAKDAQAGSSMTASGVMLGTPQYMPPEQAEGRLSAVDARSDVYSMGATLYEMIAGRPPFTGETVPKVMKQVLFDDPVSPRRWNPAVDRDLETICMKCLEKDPARRYAAAGDLAEDLCNYLESRPINAKPSGVLSRILKRAGRNRPAAAAVVVLLAVLAVGAAAAALGIGRISGVEEEKESEEQARREAEGKERIERGNKEKALGREKETRLVAEKGRKAARVLLGAYARLGTAHGDIKRAYHDASMDAAGRSAAFGKHRGEIEAFCSSAPADETSRSAMLAVRGWLLHHAGLGDGAKEDFRKSRETDPDVPWGFLFEAMTCLAKYLADQPVPRCWVGSKGFEFDSMPPESPAMKEVRERFEELIAGAAKAPAWGETLEKDFTEAAAGLAALGKGDLQAAESGLLRAADLPELAWMLDEILLGLAKVRYVSGRFDAGIKDAERVLAVHPNRVEALFFKAKLVHGSALAAFAAGADPSEGLESAVAAYGEVLARNPDHKDSLNNRAVTAISLGRIAERKKADPRKALAAAIADLGTLIALDPKNASAWCNRGNAWIALSRAAQRSGADPSECFANALADFGEALGIDPGNGNARYNRGSAHWELGRWMNRRGRDPKESFRSAIEDLGEAIRIFPKLRDAVFNRGSALKSLAESMHAAGEDPSGQLADAVRDFDSYLAGEPGDFDALLIRAGALRLLGAVRAGKGENPREALRSAIGGYRAAMKINPRFFDVQFFLAVTLMNLANEEQIRGGAQEEADSMREEALECFGEALRIRPGLLPAFLNRGLLLESLGRLGEAEAELAKALEAAGGVDEGISSALERVKAKIAGSGK